MLPQVNAYVMERIIVHISEATLLSPFVFSLCPLSFYLLMQPFVSLSNTGEEKIRQHPVSSQGRINHRFYSESLTVA